MDELTNNWLITGGCGFIGTNLVEHLFQQNELQNIRVLDNLQVGTMQDLYEVRKFTERSISEIDGEPKGLEMVVGDIREYKTCLKCTEGVNVIVHLAASTGVDSSVENPRVDMRTNVIGTFNMLEAAREREISSFVFASSGAPVGAVEPPVHEEKAPKPVSPYGASKLAGEGYCSAYYRTYGLKTVSLRFGNVYGPRSKHKSSVVAKFFKHAMTDIPLEIYGDGNQTRDFIYVKDLVRAILLASKADVGGETFQIATHQETTVNEIATMVKEIVENDMKKAVRVLYGSPRLGDTERSYLDILKAKRVLGYNPDFKLRDGLAITYSYFKERFRNDQLEDV